MYYCTNQNITKKHKDPCTGEEQSKILLGLPIKINYLQKHNGQYTKEKRGQAVQERKRGDKWAQRAVQIIKRMTDEEVVGTQRVTGMIQ